MHYLTRFECLFILNDKIDYVVYNIKDNTVADLGFLFYDSSIYTQIQAMQFIWYNLKFISENRLIQKSIFSMPCHSCMFCFKCSNICV